MTAADKKRTGCRASYWKGNVAEYSFLYSVWSRRAIWDAVKIYFPWDIAAAPFLENGLYLSAVLDSLLLLYYLSDKRGEVNI